MKKIVFIVLFILAIPVIAFAVCPAPVGNVYTPLAASFTAVQECIDAADAANGGTVQIPAGSATWSSTITKQLSHDLIILGAGQSATIITGGSSSRLFSMGVNAGVNIKISDMKLVGGAYTYTNGMMGIWGEGAKVVSNIHFDASRWTGGRGLYFFGNGVVSGCTFYMPVHGQAISVNGYFDAGTTNYWHGNPTFGSANATFIENNLFDFPNTQGDGAFDAYAGAKIVFRYNTVNGTSIGWHGNDSSSGLHSAEIYKNTFVDPKNLSSFTMNIRGGTAVVWGNTYDSNLPKGLTISHYRSCPRPGVGEAGIDAKQCDNTSGAGAIHDANSDATGYRCYQQPGATGDNGVTQWPLIEWDNVYNGVTNAAGFGFYLNGFFVKPANGGYAESCTTYDMTDHVKEGRDYINHNTCVGVSSTFCTTWWDDVNKKAKNYNPYPYPHPLTVSGLPGPPRNFR